MANPSDLDRVRSAIEALNAGTILYSEFDAIVGSVVAAGSMTREDVRHELEAALVEDKVRHDPPAQPTAEWRVPPEIAHRNSRTRRAAPTETRRRGGRSSVAWWALGIVLIAVVGGLAWVLLPGLDLGELDKTIAQMHTGTLPVVTASRDAVLASVPEGSSASTPVDTVAPPAAATAAVEPATVPAPVAQRDNAALVSSPPVPVPASVMQKKSPDPIAVPVLKPAPSPPKPENPDSPPGNAQSSPRLHLAQGYDTFADECPYPRKALAHGDTGKVGVLAFVASSGRVLNTAIDSSSGSVDLDQGAAVCVQEKARFEQKVVNGAKVGYWGRITFNWSFGQ